MYPLLAAAVLAGALVGEQLAHLGALVGVKPGVDAGDGLPDLAQPPGLFWPDVEPLGELLLGGVAAELEAKGVLGPAQPVEGVHDVGGETDGAPMVREGAGDGLPDPPRSVSREAVAHFGVELLDGPDEAGVALLDEVLERHAATPVLLGDGDHQPEVGLDELLPRPTVARVGAPAEVPLLSRVEQRAAPHPAPILRENVLCLHHRLSPLLGLRFLLMPVTSLFTPPGTSPRPAVLRASRTDPGRARPG